MKNRIIRKNLIFYLTMLFCAFAIYILSIVYSNLMEGYNIDVTVHQIETISRKIHTLYKDSDYEKISTSNLIKNGIIPTQMIFNEDNSSIINRYNGFVDIKGNSDKFYIVYNEVPIKACQKLIQKQYGTKYLGYKILNQNRIFQTSLTENYTSFDQSKITGCTGKNNKCSISFLWR